MASGERGINQSNEASLENDFAYTKYKDNESSRLSDHIMAGKAWTRVKAGNSCANEKAPAAAVTSAMKAK